MSYSRITWSNGVGGATPVNSTNLNRIEAGVQEASDRVDRLDLVQNVGNSGTAVTLNVSTNGGVKFVTLNGNATVTLAGAVNGTACTLEILFQQDATGSRTVTFAGGTIRWSGGAYVATTTASAFDRVALTTYDGGTNWWGDVIGKGYA